MDSIFIEYGGQGRPIPNDQGALVLKRSGDQATLAPLLNDDLSEDSQHWLHVGDGDDVVGYRPLHPLPSERLLRQMLDLLDLMEEVEIQKRKGDAANVLVEVELKSMRRNMRSKVIGCLENWPEWPDYENIPRLTQWYDPPE